MEVRATHCALGEGHIDRAGKLFLEQLPMGRGHDADHAKRHRRLVGLALAFHELDALPNRTAIRPEPVGERCIKDDYRRRAVGV